jgi:hypothetical protein
LLRRPRQGFRQGKQRQAQAPHPSRPQRLRLPRQREQPQRLLPTRRR